MSNALKTAISRWREIRPLPNQSADPFEGGKLSLWIATEVCRVVDELANRADFRELARAPIERLCRGSQTPEGLLIDQINSALKCTVRKLGEFLQRFTARKEVAEWLSVNPASRYPSNYHWEFEGGRSRRIMHNSYDPDSSVRIPDIDSIMREIGDFARRPWMIQTFECDYFGSPDQPDLASAELQRQREFYRRLQPEIPEYSHLPPQRLQSLEDQIFACFERRLEHCQGEMDRLCRLITILLNQCPCVTENDRQTFEAVCCPVAHYLEELRRLWHASPDDAQRQAAIQLVQIRAAFHPERSLDWLSEVSPFVGNAIVYRDFIEHCGDRLIAQQISAALLTLSELYESEDDCALQIASLAQTHSLLLIEGRGRREIYWNGDLIEIDWDSRERAWILFSNMAEQAKKYGQGVDSTMVPKKFSIRDARFDLSRLLPVELSNLILGTPTTALRLDLPSADIFYGVFREYESLEQL